MRVATPVLQSVARLAEGCVRDAESVLEQLLALGEKEITEDRASLILPRTAVPAVLDLLETLQIGETRRALELINKLFEQGVDFAQFSGDTLEILRKVLLFKITGADAVASTLDATGLERVKGLAEQGSVGRILNWIEIFLKAKQGLKNAAIPQLPLEMAVVEGCGMNNTHTNQSGKSAGTLLQTRVGTPETVKEVNTRRAPARPAKTNFLEENQVKAGLREGFQQDPRFLPGDSQHICEADVVAADGSWVSQSHDA